MAGYKTKFKTLPYVPWPDICEYSDVEVYYPAYLRYCKENGYFDNQDMYSTIYFAISNPNHVTYIIGHAYTDPLLYSSWIVVSPNRNENICTFGYDGGAFYLKHYAEYRIFDKSSIPNYQSKSDLECLETYIDSIPTSDTKAFMVQMVGGTDYTSFVQKVYINPNVASALAISYDGFFYLQKSGNVWTPYNIRDILSNLSWINVLHFRNHDEYPDLSYDTETYLKNEIINASFNSLRMHCGTLQPNAWGIYYGYSYDISGTYYSSFIAIMLGDMYSFGFLNGNWYFQVQVLH